MVVIESAMINGGRHMRELFSYIDRFSGERFVVKIDDRLLKSDMFGPLIQDLGQLSKIGVRLMVVAGARLRVDEVLTRYQMPTDMVGGIRVSPNEAMPLIEMAGFDVATKIMTRMTGQGIDAVIGNWVRARTIGVRDGIDYLSTGTIDGIDFPKLDRLTAEKIVPILPCIGWNRRGEPYNLSSNHLAGVLAQNVSAAKLIYCLAESIDLPNRLTTTEATPLLQDQSIRSGDAMELLRLSCDACEGGVDRVHILDATLDGAVLQEVFSNAGVGTMIYTTTYDAVRPFQKGDIASVMRIMQPYVADGRLLHRGESEIEARADELYVYEIDGTIHGVAGLTKIDPDHAEVYGMAIDESAINAGVGTTLIGYLLDRGRSIGIGRIFALTTQAYDWFSALGFRQVNIETLPEVRRNSYDKTRNSRIVLIDLRDQGA